MLTQITRSGVFKIRGGLGGEHWGPSSGWRGSEQKESGGTGLSDPRVNRKSRKKKSARSKMQTKEVDCKRNLSARGLAESGR